MDKELREDIFNDNEEKLVGILHWAKKEKEEIIIVCHGYNSSMDDRIVVEVCETLKNKGYNTFRFDFSGCGSSEGRAQDLSFIQQSSDLRSVIDYFSKKKYKIKSVIGHSTGGTATILRAAYDKRIESIVLIAPRIYPVRSTMAKKIENKYSKPIGEITENQEVIYPVEVEIDNEPHCFSKTYVKELATLDVIGKLKRIKRPILILHGDEDEIVEIEEGRAVELMSESSATFFPINGADHFLSHKSSHDKDYAFLSEVTEITSLWLSNLKQCEIITEEKIKLWKRKLLANLNFEWYKCRKNSLLCPSLKKRLLFVFLLYSLGILFFPSYSLPEKLLLEKPLLSETLNEKETGIMLWWVILTLISMLTLQYVNFINQLRKRLSNIKREMSFERGKSFRDASWKTVLLSWTVFLMFITIFTLTFRIFYLYTDWYPETLWACSQQFLLDIDRGILYSFSISTILRITVFFDSHKDQLFKYLFRER